MAWKTPGCPFTNELTKTWYMCTVGYYSVTKNKQTNKNIILAFMTTRVDPKSTTLSDISQTEKDKYCNGFTYMWN